MAVHVVGSTPEDFLQREWLSVNHLGGYACSTAAGLNTRKYHGLLVAAMSPPVRRMVLLSRIEETLHANVAAFPLSTAEYPDNIHPRGFERLVAFDQSPYPRWAYQGDGWTLQKELRLLPQRNAVLLQYTLLGCNTPVTLEIRPLLAMRGIHELMFQWNGRQETSELAPGHLRVEATSRTPEVYIAHDGVYNPHSLWNLNNIYRLEERRGYSALEDLWTPGVIRWTLSPGHSVHLVCSADPILLEQAIREASEIEAVRSPVDRDADMALLMQSAAKFTPIASNQTMLAQERAIASSSTFLISDSSTLAEVARPRASRPGLEEEEPRARMITQYPWSPPSGRDALIALPGLLLATRRFPEAAAMLDSFVGDLADGVMPSVYPEDGSMPRYDGADVSLWFVHAMDRYFEASGEDPAARISWIDSVDSIIECYQLGSSETLRLGITVDLDGLVSTHAAGLTTTWMDAKCGDWVVTPRAGKAVEINALWHNALCVAAKLMRSVGRIARAEELSLLAASTRHAFHQTFWNGAKRCCFDVVGDGMTDESIRPNQLFAISLPYPVLGKELHAAILNTVRNQLLTPVGIRSLAPSDASYCGQYRGNPVARDRAQHQGSVYPWLLGAFADAMIRVQGNNPSTRQQILQTLVGCTDYVRGPGLGHLNELFDGDMPHAPGGAIASARNTGEVLRACLIGGDASSDEKTLVNLGAVTNLL